MSAEVDWSALGFVRASKYRSRVLSDLIAHGPCIPTSLVESTGIEFSHVSRALGQLRDEGLAECKTPDRRKGRIYAATDAGEDIHEFMEGSG